MREKNSGFTLIELMITLSIAAILLTVAVPGFNSMVQNNRLTAQTNQLISDLSFARSESIKRNASVTLSSFANGWGDGWNVNLASDNSLLRSTEAIQNGLSITPNIDATITFNSSGNLQSDTDCFTVSDAHSVSHDRVIKIEATGRIAITDACP